LLTIAWGGYQAGEAILDELRDRTWDSQRMSALGPWSMTWGKLFGATVFTWYGGAMCLLIYVLGNRDEPADIVSKIAVTAIAGAVLVQALNLIVALTSARLVRQIKGAHGLLTALTTVVLLWVSYNWYFDTSEPIMWLGRKIPVLDFLMISAITLGGWAVLGMYRMMCTELQVPTVPWAWVAFISYLTVFVGGTFIELRWPIRAVLTVIFDVGLGIGVAAIYITAFTSYRDRLALRRMTSYANSRHWQRALEEMPLWIVSALVAALFALMCWSIAPVSAPISMPVTGLGPAAPVFWLLSIRDLLILLFFSYSPLAHRPALTALIYLALLHGLIPKTLQLFGLFELSWAFSPPVYDKPLLSSSIIAVHLMIAGMLTWTRYRSQIAPRISSSAAAGF